MADKEQVKIAKKIYRYKDEKGVYTLLEAVTGSTTLMHTLPNGLSVFIGAYKTLKSAKRGLSRYCGKMPKEIE